MRVQLLGHVGLDRTETQPRWRDPREPEVVLGDHEFGLAEHRIPEPDVDPEGLAVDLAGELAQRPEAQPVVAHAVVLDDRVIVVGNDLEGQEVAEVAATCGLQPEQQFVG